MVAPFQRLSINGQIPSADIGEEDITKWAISILKEGSEPTVFEAGANWNPAEDKFDMDDFSLTPYDFQKRTTMNETEAKLFIKSGALPVGMNDIWNNFAKASNYRFWRGAKSTDQFKRTQYNYATAHNASSTSYANPSLITSASAAGDWVDDPGAAQKEIAQCAGGLEQYGFNPATSIAFYPEVLSSYMRMPIVTGSSIFGDISLRDYILSQGVLKVVAVKDSDMHTAADGTPTKDAWDFYMIDIAKCRMGYIRPETIKITDAKPETNYNIWLDNRLTYAPLFMPHKYDGDNYIYKGVSRITAIDCSD